MKNVAIYNSVILILVLKNNSGINVVATLTCFPTNVLVRFASVAAFTVLFPAKMCRACLRPSQLSLVSRQNGRRSFASLPNSLFSYRAPVDPSQHSVVSLMVFMTKSAPSKSENKHLLLEFDVGLLFLCCNRSPSRQLRLVLYVSYLFLCSRLLGSSFQFWR